MRNPFSKIKTISELRLIAKKERARGKKIVLGHGVFDFLHYGHLYYLWQARRAGDVLVVSVLADKFITKGNNRPVFDEITRSGFIASLESVDYVVLCQDFGPWEIISGIRPDIYSKGEDSRPQLKDPNSGLNKDKKILKSVGGTLIFAKELPMHSSDVLHELVKKRGNNLSTVGASIEFLKKPPQNKHK